MQDLSSSSTITFTSGSQTPTAMNSFHYLVAWVAILAIIALINRTRFGHVVIYYALWLSLLFLFVTQYKAITAILAPLGGTPTVASTPGEQRYNFQQ